jgi:serine/threonine-protein kinase
VVYEAEHLDLGRRVALKLIASEDGKSAEIAARFRREARTLSRLSHEGLVAVHDVGQAEGGRLFCVMELLEGETLEAFLAREKRVDPPAALKLAQRILAALEVAHGAALVHRDIKPANVFLPRAGGLKLLDFGLARHVDETQPDAATRGFTLYGTPEYMAPEQAASGQIDARADLYAVGAILYEMIAGRLPFAGPSSVAVLDAKIKGSPERLPDDVSAPIDALVMKALARHPSERFQTATEMREAVAAALLPRPPRRRGRALLVATVVAAGLLAALSFTPKGKQLRASVSWLRARPPVALAQATPPDDPHDVSTLDAGDEGDVVDDTIPPPTAAPTAVAAAEPAPTVTPAEPSAQPTAEPAPQPVAAAEKPHGKKRKAKAHLDDGPRDQAKADKPGRRKHKAKVAKADQ